MLLVDDDQPEVVERREHRRARPDAHARLAAAHAPPLVVALARREPRVHDRHRVAEALDEAAGRLRRERDLGHEHDRRAAALERGRHRAQVDLGLAAAGDAVRAAAARVRAAPSSRASIAGERRRLRRGERHRARPRAHARRLRGRRGASAAFSSRTRPRRSRRRSVEWSQPARRASAAAPSGAAARAPRAPPRWRAPIRAPSASAAAPAGVSAARSERLGRSGRPAPVPVPGGSTSARPRAGVETYSRATHSPSAHERLRHVGLERRERLDQPLGRQLARPRPRPRPRRAAAAARTAPPACCPRRRPPAPRRGGSRTARAGRAQG